jgi:hypothetical protein
MNNRPLAVLCSIFGLAMITLGFPNGFGALFLVLVSSFIVILIIRHKASPDEVELLVRIFLLGLLARLLFGLIVEFFELRSFFGGDANTYSRIGEKLSKYWLGEATQDIFNNRDLGRLRGTARGMYYLTAVIFTLFGRNPYAGQSFCATIGAATAPLIYVCAKMIFNNKTVAKYSGYLVALYPAMVIWTGQLLKDGLVIFLLVLAITMVLRLQRKLNYFEVFLLGFALFGIISLRFYIFYMVVMAIVGAFFIGASASSRTLVRNTVALIVIGIGLTYVGVLRTASTKLEEFGSLERVQISRNDLAEAGSGFEEESDVSTPAGAISVMPVGLLYLMFAPFPWQMGSVRQIMAIPDSLLWWALIPFMISGVIYTIRHRLRNAVPILIFTVMLTLAYSIFQGNIGTAYRQRTQIQVFLLVFIAVGWTLRKEKIENKKIIFQQSRRGLAHLK